MRQSDGLHAGGSRHRVGFINMTDYRATADTRERTVKAEARRYGDESSAQGHRLPMKPLDCGLIYQVWGLTLGLENYFLNI